MGDSGRPVGEPGWMGKKDGMGRHKRWGVNYKVACPESLAMVTYRPVEPMEEKVMPLGVKWFGSEPGPTSTTLPLALIVGGFVRVPERCAKQRPGLIAWR
jgi:hypothetical protein